MTLGIDVFQKYNTVTSWQQVKNGGVQDVYVKLTNSTAAASPPGDSYINGARAVGINVGGYAYVTGSSSPQAEANEFAAELKRLDAFGLPPALDYEDASVPNNSSARAWIEAFFAQLRAMTGITTVILYSSGSELTNIGAGSINVPGLTIYIWDAEYGVNNGTEHPVTHYTGHVDVHQFTSVGSVAGISGAVDLDDFINPLTGEPDMQETDVIWTGSDGMPWTVGLILEELIKCLVSSADAPGGQTLYGAVWNTPYVVWNQPVSDGTTTKPAGAWLVDKSPTATVTVDQATLQAALVAAGVPTADAIAADVVSTLATKLGAAS